MNFARLTAGGLTSANPVTVFTYSLKFRQTINMPRPRCARISLIDYKSDIKLRSTKERIFFTR